ncbi:hypothetical protein ACNQFZ_08765 [Schinkia sp. CFF1]
MFQDTLKSIYVYEEGYINFNEATLIVEEDNLSWHVVIEGASDKLSSLMVRCLESIAVRLISENNEEYSGYALITEEGFLGSGYLNGYKE